MTPQSIAAVLRVLTAEAQLGLDSEYSDRQMLLESLLAGLDDLVTRILTCDEPPVFCPRCQHRSVVHDESGCRGCVCTLTRVDALRAALAKL